MWRCLFVRERLDRIQISGRRGRATGGSLQMDRRRDGFRLAMVGSDKLREVPHMLSPGLAYRRSMGYTQWQMIGRASGELEKG